MEFVILLCSRLHVGGMFQFLHSTQTIFGNYRNWFKLFAASVIKFSLLSDADSNKRVETGDTIVLYCEVSHPFAQVSWFKDGKEILKTDGMIIQSEGNMRRIVIHSADESHSGVYTCETSGDVIKFNVEVAGKRPSIYPKLSILHDFIQSIIFCSHFMAVCSIAPVWSSCVFRTACGVLSSPRRGAAQAQHGTGPSRVALSCLFRRR